ncbi:MAG: phosphomannomutase/phosphoglucomutase [Candidatus Schekmanbacteria bacterium]|nr:MAG: phosphomannomutase/phosphoglucomutase [Candidatus Schekmanbacteria bacterium]
MINPQIFRQYDIRGLVGSDLTPEVVELIGKAFATYLNREGKNKISIGYDIRLSSESFKDAIIRGATSAGCNCIDIGMVPTPVLYYSLFSLDVDGGVMITGSHNPPEFNGLKLCNNKTTLYGEEIQEIRKIIESGNFSSGNGTSEKSDIKGKYIDMIAERIKLEKPLRIVVDAGNGTASHIAPALLRKLGCEVKELFCEPDGNFPNHHPDPTIEENLKTLIETVVSGNYDMGIGYDGDADRIGVIDDKGNIIWGDQLMILFSREILKNGSQPIVFEVKCSQTLFDDVKKHGGQPIMWKAGHSLIKNKMKELNAPLGGEMSGHMFFADRYFGYDDAIYASCRMAELLSKSGKKCSELLSDIPKMYNTPEIRVDCSDSEKFKIVSEVAEYFKKQYEVIDVDGVRFMTEGGWGLIRASNTQPVLVLRFEAVSPERLNEIKKIVFDKLSEYESVKLPE